MLLTSAGPLIKPTHESLNNSLYFTTQFHILQRQLFPNCEVTQTPCECELSQLRRISLKTADHRWERITKAAGGSRNTSCSLGGSHSNMRATRGSPPFFLKSNQLAWSHSSPFPDGSQLIKWRYCFVCENSCGIEVWVKLSRRWAGEERAAL